MPNTPNSCNPCDASKILDEQFLAVRSRLIDIAAVLDRIDRAAGPQGNTVVNSDQRMQQICRAAELLLESKPGRVERVQLVFSLPVDEE